MAQDRLGSRQIVGFSLPPDLARKVKEEAARRGLSLRKLFEQMWAVYEKEEKKNNARKS